MVPDFRTGSVLASKFDYFLSRLITGHVRSEERGHFYFQSLETKTVATKTLSYSILLASFAAHVHLVQREYGRGGGGVDLM